MKKIVFAAIMAVGSLMGATNDVAVTDVYDFKAAIKVPYLSAGIRLYKNITFKGYLSVGYDEDGVAQSVTLEMKNKKTGVSHNIEMNTFMYNLMGKSNKTINRSTPTIYMLEEDDEIYCCSAAHELIKNLALAGTGSLKYYKGYTTGCGPCGDQVTVAGCNKLYKMNGYLTGIMDCECPEDEDWTHTLEAGYCGIVGERSHDAAIWGTWSATYNAKLSK